MMEQKYLIGLVSQSYKIYEFNIFLGQSVGETEKNMICPFSDFVLWNFAIVISVEGDSMRMHWGCFMKNMKPILKDKDWISITEPKSATKSKWGEPERHIMQHIEFSKFFSIFDNI